MSSIATDRHERGFGKIKKVQVWRRAKRPAKVDRRLDSENSETIEPLSSVLHAKPHVSIRDSLKRGQVTVLIFTGGSRFDMEMPIGDMEIQMVAGNRSVSVLNLAGAGGCKFAKVDLCRTLIQSSQ
ncbi:Hypothetical predicted protein [Scomber scombrus]|uniref:Uncharacterized protein n=1 Tax=Scomber scombrus TaxID=13677 RepID=A0AAV1P5L4_SCOSC